MGREDRAVHDFHESSNKDSHPDNSIGNQQITDDGYQVGAIEYTVDSDAQDIDLDIQGSGERD